MLLMLTLSFFTLIYIYLGYPMLVFFSAKLLKRNVHKTDYEPAVTILIAAYNEATCIRATIDNKLALDYPKEKLEIIVISDSSEDGTDDIVKEFSSSGVRLIRQDPRKGKTSALNLAVPVASGEILVFSDANSLYAPDALKKLMRNFSDSSVGYVTGKMIYINPDGTTIGDGCSAYMKYENWLRSIETEIGSVVGVDGGIDAVRKKLYRPMRADQLPDFVLPLDVVEQGYRVVYEPEALLMEDSLKGAQDEYRMRVRVSLRALWALWDKRGLLNPKHYGLFAVQLFSHKVLRYFAIVFIVLAYLFNAFSAMRLRLIAFLFVLQNLFHMAAFIGNRLDRSGRPVGLLSLPYYFDLINVAAGNPLLRFLRGEKQVIWTPRKG